MKGPTMSAWPMALYFGGLALLLIGQRVLVFSEALRTAVSIAGALAVLASAVVRFARSTRAEGERRAIERGLGLLGLVGFAAVLVMLATTESFEKVIGVADLEPAAKARFEGIATVGWILLLIVATLPLGFAETALFPMRHAKRIESRRVLSASLAGLTLAFAASYGALATYVTGKLDVKADFSYFRTARPGESTIKIAAALNEPVKVITFFPQLSETWIEVNGYLEDLAKHAPQLQIEHHDRVLSPGLARDNRITQDGIIVIRRDKLRETLFIGTDMAQARARLRSLDGDFQKTLLKLVRERKVAYLTTGHGELNEAAQSPDLRLAHGVRQILEAQSFAIKDLGLAQGLATDVPDDASIVLVLGPTQPLLPAEIEALERYAKRGGHLLLALDPEAGIDHSELARIAGLSWHKTLLANDRVHVRKRFNDSDRTVLATHQYSAHASVTTLGRAGRRAPIVMPGASALEKLEDADPALHVDFAVRSLPETFDDLNGNSWYDMVRPYDGLAIRKRISESSWYSPRGSEYLITATLVRERPAGKVEKVVVSVRNARIRNQRDRERSDLVATAAHELRSPLTGIKGFTSTLLTKWEKFSEDQRRLMLETVDADADRLTRLISELLDAARIDAGRLTLRPGPVRIGELVNDVLKGISAASGERYTVDLIDDPDLIWADADRIAQVVTNLVENANRHGLGLRLIRIQNATRGGEDGVSVQVHDNGPGIPEESRQRVFSRFWRSGPGAGSGLGMYIVRGITEEHGGRIDIVDSDDGGACVRVWLPVNEPPGMTD